MDFHPQLASVGDFVQRADIAVCHSEVPFAPEGGPYESYPLFAAPPVIATAVRELGWDLCTTASNHTMDQGWEGLVRTVETYRSAGVRTVGTAVSEQESRTPTILETAAGVKVGFVSQTFGLNGIPKTKGKDWSVQLLDASRAIADAERAKAAGADVVAVHVHAGTEYQQRPDPQQRAFVEAVTRSDAVDVVFGQHTHVVQPIEKVHGKWVLFGSGNLIAQSGPAQPRSYDGYMAEIRFDERPDGRFVVTRVEWAPTHITKHRSGSPARVYLVPDALAKGQGPAAELRRSAARTRAVVAAKAPEGLVERGREIRRRSRRPRSCDRDG